MITTNPLILFTEQDSRIWLLGFKKQFWALARPIFVTSLHRNSPLGTKEEAMNKVIKVILIFSVLFFASLKSSYAQINNAVVDTVHVYGNCGMCETTIENSALKKNVAQVDWDRYTKMAVVTYDSKKTTLAEVLKRIADAGYDNEMFTAPDAAYNKLHACCKYERKPAE